MKKVKNIISLILVCCMIFSMTGFSYASPNGFDVKPKSIDPGDGRDIVYAPKGGTWRPRAGSPDPDGPFFVVIEKTFLTYDEANALYVALDNPTATRAIWEEYRTKGLNLAITLAVGKLNIKRAAAGWLVGDVIAEVTRINDLFEMSKRELYDAIRNGSGVEITSTISSSGPYNVWMNYYSPWAGTYIWGEPGYEGRFDLTDKTPMFY